MPQPSSKLPHICPEQSIVSISSIGVSDTAEKPRTTRLPSGGLPTNIQTTAKKSTSQTAELDAKARVPKVGANITAIAKPTAAKTRPVPRTQTLLQGIKTAAISPRTMLNSLYSIGPCLTIRTFLRPSSPSPSFGDQPSDRIDPRTNFHQKNYHESQSYENESGSTDPKITPGHQCHPNEAKNDGEQQILNSAVVHGFQSPRTEYSTTRIAVDKPVSAATLTSDVFASIAAA